MYNYRTSADSFWFVLSVSIITMSSIPPNGATGSGPPNPKKPTKKRVNGVSNGHHGVTNGVSNGHHEVTTSPRAQMNGHTETYAESTSSSGYDSPNGCEDSRHHPAVNGVNGHSGVQLVYKDHKTFHIVKRIFFNLMSASNVDREVLRCFEVSERALLKVQGCTIIKKASDFTAEYILTSEHTLQALLQDFITQQWDIRPTNMQSEYRRVADSMFSDKVTWGRIISFLRFAVAFTIYIHSRGMGRAVQSIEAWTVEVLQEDLGTFFAENDGWVSTYDNISYETNLLYLILFMWCLIP